MTITRRGFIGVAAAATAQTLLAQPRANAQEARRPNIVLIMTDDLGYGHLGCYGQKHIRTPHLDKLAAEGLRFTDAYAGCPQCAPSRSVLMTGLHSGHTPVRGNAGGIPLRDEDVTFAEVLQDAGYHTALFGKWGLGEWNTSGEPDRQGFDEYFGYLHQKHAHFYYSDYLWHNGERHIIEENKFGKREVYTHDLIMDRAVEYIGQKHDDPFFCFISLTIPHHEWTVPEESLAEYAGKFKEDPPEHTWREGYACPEMPKANMAAMITHMDKGVGMVMDAIDRAGIGEDTLVIFTSDNGADSYSLACADFFKANGDLRGYKYDMYEGGIRVPTIAHWPGTIAPGTESDLPWHFADVFPTFADLAGKKVSGVDGTSIAPLLTGNTDWDPGDRFLFWESGGNRAARMGPWKVVQPEKDAAPELYNLRDDLSESRNIAADYPDLVAKLVQQMDANHEPAPPQINPDAPDGQYYR